MSDKLDRVIEAAVTVQKVYDVRVGTILPRRRLQANKLTHALKVLAKAVKDAALLPREPVFCLRGKDRAATRTIAFWIMEAERLHAQPETLSQVRGGKLEAFEAWQGDVRNNLYLKVPD